MLSLMRTPPEVRSSVGRAARDRILTGFSMDAKVREWEVLYQSVLQEN
jgi:hypothetical protein